MKIRERIIEAIKKSNKFFWDVLKTSPPRLIYVSGNPLHYNLGDNTLFASYKKLFYNYDFVHYPGGRILYIPNKLFKISSCAILAGGTLINRWGLSAAYECIDIFPKFYVFGTGVAQPSFWSHVAGWKDTINLWKKVLARCEYIGVRGPLSADVLINNGIKNVEVIGDPVLVFAKENLDDNTSYIPNSVGLNIGHSFGNIWGSEETVCNEFIKLASLVKENGWIVKWFIVWPNDVDITYKAAKCSGTSDYIYEIYKDYNKYFKLVESLRMFVGMKLHSVVLSTCMYVPSIMLEYRPKCRDYMQSINQEENTIRTDEFKAHHVWEIMKNWNSKRGELSQILYASIKPLRTKQKTKSIELMEVIKNYQ